MTIPFLDIFKKLGRRQKAEAQASQPSRALPAAPQKPAGERLSKTVMPNTTRSSSSSSDFFKTAGDSSPNVRAAAVRVLPPTVALALQPKVERAISLALSDVVERIPVGFLKPAESFDVSQTILLKASEIEKGMADGKPAVSLFSIYEQVPDIFTRNVRPDDATQIAVPHAKVLDQLRKMQVRDDQEVETTVPQVDTPILQVTIEDTARFGTKLPPITTSADQPVKVEPPTARAFSSAEPEPAVQEKAAAPPSLAGLNLATPPPRMTPRPGAPDPVAPSRIPFKLPPKGTDEPAPERVPASSSSSVPLSVPVSSNPTRIPFKMTPPSDDLKPKLRLIPGVSADDMPKPAEPAAAAPSTAKVSLELRAVLQNVPSFQLHKPAETVPADVRVELPLSLVESQLASGRVAIPVKVFRDAVPEEHKNLLVVDAAESPVLLPLQEVLKNLAPSLLKMRDDQVIEEVAQGFETPFSIKAAEDARRFEAELAESRSDAPVEAKAKEEKAQAPSEAKQEKPQDAPTVTLPKIELEKKPAVAVEAKTEAPSTPPANKISIEEKPKILAPSPAVSVMPPAPEAKPAPTQPAIKFAAGPTTAIPTPAATGKIEAAIPPVAKEEVKIPTPTQPAIKFAAAPKIEITTPAVAVKAELATQPPAVKEVEQPVVPQSGGPVPIVRQSGGPVPIDRQSGGPAPIDRQSGGPTTPTQPVLKLPPVQLRPTVVTPAATPSVQSKPAETKPESPSSATPPANKISPIDGQSGGSVPIVRQSGGPVPIDRQSGGPVPIDRQSGGPVPIDRQSGAPVPMFRQSDAPLPPAFSPKDFSPAPRWKIVPKIEAPVVAKSAPVPLPVAKTNPVANSTVAPVLQTMPVPSQVPAAPAPITPTVPVAPMSAKPAVAVSPNKPSTQLEKGPEVNTSAKAVMEDASRLTGVAGATVMFEDGLALAGNLPDSFQAGGLCAIAPSILKKINRHTVDTKFGPLVSMTLAWNDAQLSFFMAGGVCVGVVHAEPVLPAETHHRLTLMTEELSRTYAQPGNKHVDY